MSNPNDEETNEVNLQTPQPMIVPSYNEIYSNSNVETTNPNNYNINNSNEIIKNIDNGKDIEKPLLYDNNSEIKTGDVNENNKPSSNQEENDENEYEKIQSQNFKIIKNNLICNRNINPISQYNYFISICNLSICRPKSEKFWSIPFCSCFGSIYDLYVILVKGLAIVAGCLCEKGCKCLSKAPGTQGMVEINHYTGSRRYYTEATCNIVYLFFALLFFALAIWISLYILIVLMIPHAFFTLYVFIGNLIHLRNKSKTKQKRNFTDFMVYDSNLDENILNESILIVSPADLEKYSNEVYYEELKRLYTERNDTSKPQKFVVFGETFMKLSSGIFRYFIYQVIFSLLIGAIFYAVLNLTSPTNKKSLI